MRTGINLVVSGLMLSAYVTSITAGADAGEAAAEKAVFVPVKAEDIKKKVTEFITQATTALEEAKKKDAAVDKFAALTHVIKPLCQDISVEVITSIKNMESAVKEAREDKKIKDLNAQIAAEQEKTKTMHERVDVAVNTATYSLLSELIAELARDWKKYYGNVTGFQTAVDTEFGKQETQNAHVYVQAANFLWANVQNNTPVPQVLGKLIATLSVAANFAFDRKTKLAKDIKLSLNAYVKQLAAVNTAVFKKYNLDVSTEPKGELRPDSIPANAKMQLGIKISVITTKHEKVDSTLNTVLGQLTSYLESLTP
jgi:hypothetical protein